MRQYGCTLTVCQRAPHQPPLIRMLQPVLHEVWQRRHSKDRERGLEVLHRLAMSKEAEGCRAIVRLGDVHNRVAGTLVVQWLQTPVAKGGKLRLERGGEAVQLVTFDRLLLRLRHFEGDGGVKQFCM